MEDLLEKSPVVEKIEIEKKTKKESAVAEDSEALDAQVESEMEKLEGLLEELERKFEFFASENNLIGKEKTEKKKEMVGVFKTDIVKVGEKKNSELKLSKILEIQEAILKNIEVNNSEAKTIYPLDQEEIVSNGEKEETSQMRELDSFNNELTKGLEEEFLSSESLEIADDKKNLIVGESNGDNGVKQVPEEKYSKNIIDKAIKDKKFAQDLANHEIAEEIASIEKASERNKKELKGDIEKFKKELPVVFNEIRKKFISFHKKFSGSEEGKLFTDKLEGTINGYAKKIHEFDVIDIYDTRTLTKINQLHHELETWLDKDWNELSKRKMETGVFKNEADGALEDLDLGDLHGSDSPVAESVEEMERNKKVTDLEKEYGRSGASYVKNGKSGFPEDSFTIVGYYIGEDEKNTGVIIGKLVDEKYVEETIELKKFKKYIEIYTRDIGNIDKIEKTENDESNRESLSKEERVELVALIGEKWVDIENDYASLMKQFHDFRDEYKDEVKYHKLLLRKTLDINEKKIILGKVVKENVQISQELLNELMELDDKIINFIKSDWNKELKEFKGEIEFTSEEKEAITELADAFEGFRDSLEKGSSWDEYNDEERNIVLDILTKVEIRKAIKEAGITKDRIEQITNSVMDILIKK